MHLWILKCVPDFWRHYEPGVHSDGLRQDHEKEPDRFLYLRCTCRSGTGNFYRDLSVDLKQTYVRKTGKSKKKIRAVTAA